MFGKNPIRSAESDPLRLAITSIFYTLQGEGPFSGEPALFIRLAGCNLACTFCDTEFEAGVGHMLDMGEIGEMLLRFSRQQRRLVVITGGEPLRQAGIVRLCQGLYDLGTEHIQIETAGTLWVDGLEEWANDVDMRMTIVCSPKTPRVDPAIQTFCHHWKYIVKESDARDAEDGLPVSGTQRATIGKPSRLARPRPRTIGEIRDKVWLSPCDEYDTVRNHRNMILARDLCLRFGYRLSLQVHKIVGVE